MQVLYQSDLLNRPCEAIIPTFFLTLSVPDFTLEWAKSLAIGAWEYQSLGDQWIAEHAIGWSLDRMNPIDKSLIRLALYEIRILGTPPQVVINEVIELARQFSTEDSPKFINGILGKEVTAGCSLES